MGLPGPRCYWKEWAYWAKSIPNPFYLHSQPPPLSDHFLLSSRGTSRDQRSLRFGYDRARRTQSKYHGRPNRTPGRAPDYPWSTAPKPAPTHSYRRSVTVDACAREDSFTESALQYRTATHDPHPTAPETHGHRITTNPQTQPTTTSTEPLTWDWGRESRAEQRETEGKKKKKKRKKERGE